MGIHFLRLQVKNNLVLKYMYSDNNNSDFQNLFFFLHFHHALLQQENIPALYKIKKKISNVSDKHFIS